MIEETKREGKIQIRFKVNILLIFPQGRFFQHGFKTWICPHTYSNIYFVIFQRLWLCTSYTNKEQAEGQVF